MKLQFIPQRIAKSLGNKLEAYVSLTGPSGSTWKVELTATGDTFFLKNWWKEFVDAHSLDENDLLVFKYTGASRFDVSVTKRSIAVNNDTTNGVSEAAAKKKSKHASIHHTLTVPSEWARRHLPRRSQPVILRYNETMCEATYSHTDYGGALTGNWKQFCNDTFLGPYDVCVFNLVSGETENQSWMSAYFVNS
ncbi:hypothetical protein H5410_024535 [Solanum commersonii]|uniref:TF-B3 domain-containing protein n=1 Tax=Solanum commersonii TaxID=4109 RepID=A0A9J5ZMA0_SOLCO|nr:hypothetical protein H5410_024535 [Solanum commersonii]